MTWTQFHDMHSGGGQKLQWARIYIEAPKDEAEIIFQNRFGRNPHRVTCTCCGEDYSLSEEPTLEKASWYERGCMSGYIAPDGRECSEDEGWVRGKEIRPGYTWAIFERGDPDRDYKRYIPLSEYIKQDDVLVIRADEIKASERVGELRSEGYVWAE